MTTLIVSSHPNHELAIFGFLQRVRPHLVYLTDGGGPDRVAQTQQGLRSIGLIDHARFLNHTEKSFYDGLLDLDLGFFEMVGDDVRAAVQTLQPERILCDAIEFYNPVHDVTLPIVRAALRGLSGVQVFEVPLIHQRPAVVESYTVQRLPASRCSGEIELRLSEEELATKTSARDRIYTILVDQLGWLISDLPASHIAREVIVPACPSLPQHGTDVILRYERRAQKLSEIGEIERKITYQQHYLPVASSLWESSVVAREPRSRRAR